MIHNYKYVWGQSVRVIPAASKEMRPLEIGSICGIRKAGDDWLYLVEFSDGESVEIPEFLIEATEVQ